MKEGTQCGRGGEGLPPTPSALKQSFDALAVKLDSSEGKGRGKKRPRGVEVKS